MSTQGTPKAETAFHDIDEVKLDLLKGLSEAALGRLEDADLFLRASESPMPVLSVSVNYAGVKLPSIWMGLGMTNPGRGLLYASDSTSTDSRITSDKVLHGLEIPVLPDHVSSIKFFPPMPSDNSEGASPSRWEHWQRHSIIRHNVGDRVVRVLEREVAFPPFATWFKKTRVAEFFSTEDEPEISDPIVIFADPDASDVELIPSNMHGHFFDGRRKQAIFVGQYATQALLSNTSRMGVPQELAPQPFNEMMSSVAAELGLDY